MMSNKLLGTWNLECARMPALLVNCTVNDGLVNAITNMQQPLLLFKALVYTKSSAIYNEYFTGI